MSRIVRIAVLGGLVLALVLLSVEVALRAFQPPALQYYRSVKLLHVLHKDYHVGLPANADIYVRHHAGLWEGRFTTNSLGYRGSPEPDPSRSQLACLGDSIVMGFGVSDTDTFCHGLNGLEIDGQSFQAMNLGLDAFGSMGSAKRLAEAAPTLNLKLALFFPSPNDFEMPEELRRLGQLPDDEKDAQREREGDSQFLFRLQFEATRISYALHALKLAVEQLKVRRFETQQAVSQELTCAGVVRTKDGKRLSPLRYFTSAFYRSGSTPTDDAESAKCAGGAAPSAPPAAVDYGDPALFRKKYCPPPLRPGTVCTDKEPQPGTLKPLPESTTRAYRSMIATARRHGIRLVVVMLPIENEVLQCSLRGSYSRHFNFALRVRDFFQKEQVAVLDLRPHVHRMCGEPITERGRVRPSRVEDYFIPADGHFTVPGNRWAAESLREELARLRF